LATLNRDGQRRRGTYKKNVPGLIKGLRSVAASRSSGGELLSF